MDDQNNYIRLKHQLVSGAKQQRAKSTVHVIPLSPSTKTLFHLTKNQPLLGSSPGGTTMKIKIHSFTYCFVIFNRNDA